MRKKGFTLIELLVVIAIIAMLLAILMPALSKVKKIAQRVVCGTNLKGLGTAQTVYANDYDDEYVVQGGNTNPNWSNGLASPYWHASALPWNSTANTTIGIGTSLYLLVREADVSPKSFVCPAGGETAFDGKNTDNRDLIQLWDFGTEPWNRVSYAYHAPYRGNDTGAAGTTTGKKSRFAPTGTQSAAFAVMADKNPFQDAKLSYVGTGMTPPTGSATQQSYVGQSQPLNFLDNAQRFEVLVANAQPHDREGQNVLFADGHTAYETRSDVGVKNDNIYTRWLSASPAAANQQEWRTGALGSTVQDAWARSRDDSILVNDMQPMTPFPHP